METIELLVEKTMVPLELSVAKEMVARYNSTRKTLIDETYDINDTRSIWFSIDGFKDFVNNLPENASGVRIHLVAYGQNARYPNQTTVIWTPTVEQGYQHVDVLRKGGESFAADKTMIAWNAGKDCPPVCTIMKSFDSSADKTMVPIELSIAKEMVALYNDTRKTLIDETYNINDTRSIWFSIDGFKDFVNNLPENASGIRIHLAVHDQENKHTPNQTTVIFAATIENGHQNVDVVGQGHELINTHPFMTAFGGGKDCPPLCHWD